MPDEVNPASEAVAEADEAPSGHNPGRGEETATTERTVISDFIRTYIQYADVIEAPPEAHEAVGIQLLAAALNPNVCIQHGGIRVPLDVWLLLLSESGFGRNTLVELARPVLHTAGLDHLIISTTWGSKQAFYQSVAVRSSGLFIWPELAVVLSKLRDRQFGGVKEWLTDRYDNPNLPEVVRYRETGRPSDTPPIVFGQAPRLNILATSSLDWFFSNLAQEDALGGFVPRWILKKVGTERIVPIPRTPDAGLTQPLGDHLRRASELRGVPDLSGVQHIYERWYVQTRRRFLAQSNPAMAMPFFNRLRTHVLKLAVAYEVSQSLNLRVSRVAIRIPPPPRRPAAQSLCL
jgi:hypothetical protein